MITVKFYNLIRSHHGIEEIQVKSGTIQHVINQVRAMYPNITMDEFMQAILFINQEKVMHLKRLNELVNDGDVVVFTNFVGGG